MKAMGPSQEVIAQYERDSLLQASYVDLLPEGVRRRETSGHVEILSAQVTDYDGHSIEEVRSNQGICLSVEGFCHDRIASPLFAFAILDSIGDICWWNFSAEDGFEFEPLQGHFRVIAKVPPLPLRAGRYAINFTLRDKEGFVNLERLWLPTLVIKEEGRAHGLLKARAEWRLERS